MKTVAVGEKLSVSGKWRPYPEYKDSGVEWLGEIPAGWGVKRLKMLANLMTGNTPPKAEKQNYKNGTIPWVKPEDLIGSKPIFDSQEHLSEIGAKLARLIPVGSALVCCIGSVGKVGVTGTTLATNQQINAIIFNRKDMYIPNYGIYSLIVSEKEHKKHANKVVVSILNKTGQGFIKFPVPSLPEQRAIAAFLDRKTAHIDALIEKKRRLISLLEEKRAALISHAVTKGLDPNAPMKDSGVEWLGKIPAHWTKGLKITKTALDEKNSFVNGPFGSNLLTSELTNSGVPVIYIRDIKPEGYRRISTACVTPEKATQLDFCRVDPGDVLITKVGDPPGIAAVYPEDEPPGIVTQDVIRIKPNIEVVNPNYLALLFNSKYGQAIIDQISVDSTRTRIGLGTLKSIRIALPISNEQKIIIEFLKEELARIDALISKINEAVDKLQEYRTALISAAVTGKIDVRTEEREGGMA